jgi:hypothetical protein
MNLPGVGMAEASDLQISDDQTFQSPVEKAQIDPEPLVVDS